MAKSFDRLARAGCAWCGLENYRHFADCVDAENFWGASGCTPGSRM